jgi:hypothetical protein
LRGILCFERQWVWFLLGLVFAVLGVRPALAGEAPPNLGGRWALVEVMPGLADLPIVGHVELTTISALFVDVTQSGSRLALSQTYVFVDVKMSPSVVTTTVPEAFVSSLPVVVRPAELQPAIDGWTLVSKPHTEVRGAHLADPLHDSLPSSPSDPRVFDQDGDGHPGLTVHVRLAGVVSGNTYVVQRLTTALRGSVDDASTITGTVYWTGEENVIAASNPLLKMSYTYTADATSTDNVFVMRRVDGSWTAHTLRDHLSELLALARTASDGS